MKQSMGILREKEELIEVMKKSSIAVMGLCKTRLKDNGDKTAR